MYLFYIGMIVHQQRKQEEPSRARGRWKQRRYMCHSKFWKLQVVLHVWAARFMVKAVGQKGGEARFPKACHVMYLHPTSVGY